MVEDEKLKEVMKMGRAYTAKQVADALGVSEEEAKEALELAETRGWIRGGYGRGRGAPRLEEKHYIRRR